MLEYQQFPVRVRATLFVDVILPLAITGTYTYRIPNEWNEQVRVGKRVIVQFGKNKIYSAVIVRLSEQPPKRYEAKYILDILDDTPVVDLTQLKLWEWLASYYICNLGEVMQAAMPAALKLASETRIVAAPQVDSDAETLNDKEFLILEALGIAKELKVSEVVKLLGQSSVFPLLKKMFDKGLILISEEIVEKYKPKKKSILRLHTIYHAEDAKRILLDSLNNAPKQQDAVLAYLQLSRTSGPDVGKAELMEASGVSASVVTALVQKEVFLLSEKQVSRFAGEEIELSADFDLSTTQSAALSDIKGVFEQQDVVLLHGVTASGKTQVYIRLIEDILQSGKQVLYLLPEIALTSQITERLQLHFGHQLGVYHSRFNDNERAEVWYKVMNNEFKVVIGARSAVFLPFHQLGLVVVDEEHEISYKQFDPAPRYHARDTAIYLAHLHQAKVILGSATPSLESYYNAKSGKYGLVEMLTRYGDSKMPDTKVVDIVETGRKEEMYSYFSKALIAAVENAIAHKQQIILFQNRRGHTPLSQCRTCGHVAKCLHCDVSLTYHKFSGKLHCHYCGYTEAPMGICTACGSTHIESKGFGTQRIEEELEVLLPNARIGRLDLDSTRGKYGYERVLHAFDNHQYDILIGTQMVAKGLDFGNVSVIGILNADYLINYPDFRAYERAFSLLAQVGGRSGRRDKAGTVFIQTRVPNHRVISQIIQNDYAEMFAREIADRKKFDYPPFYRLIAIAVKHKQLDMARDAAFRLARMLRETLGGRVLGPETPLVGRVRNYYIQSVMLKVERQGTSIIKVKEYVLEISQLFRSQKENKGVILQIDVDPY